MQSKGRLVLLLLVGVIVAFTAVVVRQRLNPPPEPPPVSEKGEVLSRVMIVKREIPAGSFVQLQDLEWQMLPADYPNRENYIQESGARIEDFNGAVVRKPLRMGEPVSPSSLMKAGEGGFLSAVLEPGMRAISVAVNATSGNAGFISPGDRVDMIVTHRIKETGGGGEKSNAREIVVSETFVRDVRVVAVDQQLDNPENKAILAKTVTIEVSPKQAELVAVGAEMGKISLALRSIANVSAVQPAAQPEGAPLEMPAQPSIADVYGGPARDSDISQLLNHNVNTRVRVIRGEESENVEFY